MDEQFQCVFSAPAGRGGGKPPELCPAHHACPRGRGGAGRGAWRPSRSSPRWRPGATTPGFDKTLGTALRGSMLVVIPLTAYMMAVALPTLGFIFEGGRFFRRGNHPRRAAAPDTAPFSPLLGRTAGYREGFLRPSEHPHPGHCRHCGDPRRPAVYPLAVKLWGAFGVAMLTTLCLFVYTLALSWFWIRKHGTGRSTAWGICFSRGSCWSCPARCWPFRGLRASRPSAPLGSPPCTPICPAAMRHAVICGIAGVIFAVPYLLLAKLFMPEALSLRRRR